MVSKRKVDHGFRGFQVPFIPKFRRSARRQSPLKKPTQDGRACAFELLASLAGQLLQESESSASSNASEGNNRLVSSQGVVEQKRKDEVKPLTAEGIQHGSCTASTFMTEASSQKSGQKHLECTNTGWISECISVHNSSNCWEKVEPDAKSGHHCNRLAKVPEDFRESCDDDIENGFGREHEESLDDKFSLKNALELHVNSPVLFDSNSDVKSPFRGESFPNASFSKHGTDSMLGYKDDDENILRCKKVCTKSKAFTPQQLIARRKVRKMLAHKYWKVAPKLKGYENSRSVEGVKPLYRKRKTNYSFERYQHDALFKRRKFFDRCSVVTSDGGYSSVSVSNSHGDNPAKLHVSKDSHVKFSIKSIRIPELYIEVPETATVGSLKRAVMETVMSILGDGVHIGVLVQGKKIRDDNRTLLQTGICCKEKLDKLGFTLEPNTCKPSPAVCVGDPSQCETSQPTGSPETPALDSGITDALQDSSLLTNTGNLVETNHEPTSSPTYTIADKLTPDSGALVAVPATTTEVLAVVPVSQKTRRSEFVQRRTRRPFSVSEVEALVQAIEELGTGRWRDVKLRAFENAEHRTYVDLKDKWKTLVHTAKISPQQRRGEPVPQELLDRVLAAHAYWTHYQSQQHVKHQAEPMEDHKSLC